ncbi:DUF4258 domain-containing protein [Kitasatospora sp. MAP5-34]|uniref:DUF4258 domain-containing protein n=1 Tax=Kitasatospora sp. MAP5-34 TaxID=3035102 RepID=UPI002475FF1D|nr:DUF4258 domain-containing protein [Kitasatospora sp. MAP5-34]MDH6580519.1 hypothetical protein [Kitasatospora sp. MAP5-34]
MLGSKKVALALLAPLAAMLALAPTSALAASPAAATPTAVARWAPPFQPPTHCDSEVAPSAVNRLSWHVQDRMAERGISRKELDDAIRIRAPHAECVDGKWRYDLGMSGGLLTVIVGVGEGGWVAITAWWNDPKASA